MDASIFNDLLKNVEVRESINEHYYIIESKANEYDLFATCEKDFTNLDVERIGVNGEDEGIELTFNQEENLLNKVFNLIELEEYEANY